MSHCALGQCSDVVNIVSKLEGEGRWRHKSSTAGYMGRLDAVVLKALGYLPFAQIG